jgi:hypothetical protein
VAGCVPTASSFAHRTDNESTLPIDTARRHRRTLLQMAPKPQLAGCLAG